MVTEAQIVKGEVSYTLEEFYNDIHYLFNQMKEPDAEDKERKFNAFFLFIMLSAEDKPEDTMIKLFPMTLQQIVEGREAFKDQIDICRAIHMRKYLDLFSEYMATTAITIHLLNKWIQNFLKTHIQEEPHGTP